MVEKEVVGNLSVIWLCGGKTADITPSHPLKFNMNDACEKCRKQHFKIRVKSQMVLMFDYMKLDVSLFDGGRMLIKNVTDKETPLKAYREILRAIDVTI
ncbi:MAG TPA: hypothetical protein VK536_03685 [Candidatus Limnocylindrales bacterium]|nr:hypothetical protein [Candidatus Limnocylindrales bacterium]